MGLIWRFLGHAISSFIFYEQFFKFLRFLENRRLNTTTTLIRSACACSCRVPVQNCGDPWFEPRLWRLFCGTYDDAGTCNFNIFVFGGDSQK